jgi:hypothetical protein
VIALRASRGAGGDCRSGGSRRSRLLVAVHLVIAGGSVDRQRNACRKSGLESFGFSGLEALGVMDSMDHGHEHEVLRSGDCVTAYGERVTLPVAAHG